MPLDHTRNEFTGIVELLQHCQFSIAKKKLSFFNKILFVGSGESLIVGKVLEKALSNHERYSSTDIKAVQSYEFLVNPLKLTSLTLVVIITSSGRPSPTLEAFRFAFHSQAKTMVVTNNIEWRDQIKPDYLVATGATKNGIPTQSTIAAILLLLKRFLVLTPYWDGQTLAESVSRTIKAVSNEELDLNLCEGRSSNWICLGTGYGIEAASSMSNLLAMGAMVEATSYAIEEYNHSLRKFIIKEKDRFFIFDDNSTSLKLVEKTIADLLERGCYVFHYHSYDSHSLDIEVSARYRNIYFQRGLSMSREIKALHLMLCAQQTALVIAEKSVKNGLVRANLKDIL
ncbi:hypothetical protein L1D34_21805 [Vibrio mediterranei]|uniref:hypothetical protein n=1 Tax=Vibrio mediterranei TaxID=689 RepID=UPI001EFE5F80|nr:hypothetical protein [Vibrio mediterranei]MCG9627472.1 hypothetical protein [Vibrio mediterranei]